MAGTNTENGNNQNACIKLESVDRISKLPVVESTLQIGKSVYDKVKDYNSVTNWTITTAESTVCKAVEAGKPYASPVVHSFEGPIKKVDGMICSGLDYVESKIPAVKLPPNEIYNSTKGYIDNSPTVQTAKGYVEPAVETAKSTVQGAKSMVEPALESAKKKVGAVIEQAEHMVEPYMNSSMEKATAIKEYGTQKIEQYLHTSSKNGDNKDQLEEDEEEESPVPRTECSTEVQKR